MKMELDYCNLNIPLHFFNNICRVCLTKSKLLIPIYEINLTHNLNPLGIVESVPLIVVFQKYCGVDVSADDNKPGKICESCMNGVCKAYNVFELFLQSNILLDTKLKKHNIKKQENLKRNDCVDDLSPDINSTISEGSGDNAFAFGNYSNKENIDNDKNSIILPVDKTETSKKSLNLTFDTDFININEEADTSKTLDANRDHLDKEVVHKIKSTVKSLVKSKSSKEAYYGLKKIPYRMRLRSPPRFIDPKGLLGDHTYSVNESTFLRLLQGPRKEKKRIRPKKPKKPKLVKPRKILALLESEEPEKKIFNCKFCEIELEGMQTVLEHVKEKHFAEKTCILCPRVLTRYGFMVNHVLSHCKYGVRCTRCLKFFKDEASLQLHKESEDHKELITCSICKKGYVSYRRLKFHMEGMHNPENKRRYQCSQCGVMKRWKHNLYTHMLTHQDKEKGRMCLCQYCGKGFYNMLTLKQHVKRIHEVQLLHLRPEGKLHFRSRKLRSPRACEGTFECKICTRVFNFKSSFFAHWLTHPDVPVNCPYCDKILDSPKAFKAHREAEHRSFICEVCRKGFETEKVMRHHRNQHRNNRIYSCGDCGLAYKSFQTLQYHKLSHSGERPHECEVCGKTFVQLTHKRRHKMYIHPNKQFCKRLKCTICGKAFENKGLIVNHMRSHTGEKPFSCPYCSNTYRDTTARHKHVKRNHPDKMDDFILYKSRHQKAENEKAKEATTNSDLTSCQPREIDDDEAATAAFFITS